MDIVPQLTANSIIAGSLYALLALGFTLIFNVTKFFNFAHGPIALVGGYTVVFLALRLGLPVIPSALAALCVAGLAGYGLDKLVYSPLRKKKASNMVLLLASFGASIVIPAVIAIFFTSQFQNLPKLMEGQNSYAIGGAVITHIQTLTLLFSFLVAGGLMVLLKKTTFGKAVKAISDDEEVAQIVGIHTNRIIGYVFLIGSAIAGLAGVLAGLNVGLHATQGLSFTVKAVIASIVGGLGSIPGALLGGFLLGVVENFGVWKIAVEWQDAIAFGLLIGFLLFRPKGILQK